jgi:hypothetical protein
MAQLFPTSTAGSGGDDPRSWLVETLLALPDGWTLLTDRHIGGEHAVHIVLIHPDIGVALIDAAPRDPAAALGAFRADLEAQRFAEFYPGDLPIVGLSIAPEEIAEIGDRLAAAFEAAPRLTIADGDWADAVIEVLLTPADLPMAPVHEPIPESEPVHQPAAEEPIPEPEPIDEPTVEEPIPEPEPAPVYEPAADERLEPAPEMPAPLPLDMPSLDSPMRPMMLEWPFEPREQPRARPGYGRWAAAAAALLLFCGVGLAAWTIGEREQAPADAALPSQEAEAPVPPQLPASEQKAADARPAATPTPAPPPVPPAKPVILAAKPLASPPPAAPTPTPVEPLPVILAAKPLAPLPPAAPKPTPVEPLPQIAANEAASTPPPAKAVSPPPAARPSAPARTLATAPRPSREARLTPARRHPAETERGPPIDATDLPPLEPATRAEPPADRPGSGSSVTAAAPPIAITPAAQTAPEQRECRPYTAETPIAGRGLAVQGIACRDADGAWRLVSEVPLR